MTGIDPFGVLSTVIRSLSLLKEKNESSRCESTCYEKSKFKIAASRFASSPKVVLVIKTVIRIKNFKTNE